MTKYLRSLQLVAILAIVALSAGQGVTALPSECGLESGPGGPAAWTEDGNAICPPECTGSPTSEWCYLRDTGETPDESCQLGCGVLCATYEGISQCGGGTECDAICFCDCDAAPTSGRRP
jgi:hypothetical protein